MDIADAQVEDMQKRMKDEFAQTLQYQGISLEQYMQIVNVTEESLMERIKPDALKRIRLRTLRLLTRKLTRSFQRWQLSTR